MFLGVPIVVLSLPFAWLVLTRLRRDARSHHRPIIVLTACAWVTERERAAREGCDMFLAKPCLPDELLRHGSASGPARITTLIRE